MSRLIIRRVSVGIAGVVCALVFSASSAYAQAVVRGTVVDQEGTPVEGVTITITHDESGREFTVQTNGAGEFVQIGLTPGRYRVLAVKDTLKASAQTQASTNPREPLALRLLPPAVDPAAGLGEKLQALNQEAVAASQAGDHALAIEKYVAILEALPECTECHDGIGREYIELKDFAQAESAFNMAIKLDPEYGPAYAGLAIVYNRQGKLDDAAAASAKAVELSASAGGASDPDALYNQGVIAWNQGKAEEARGHFQAVLATNPDHAPSHFQLGMTYVNSNLLPEAKGEFEMYLKLAPDGQFADQAKAMIGAIP